MRKKRTLATAVISTVVLIAAAVLTGAPAHAADYSTFRANVFIQNVNSGKCMGVSGSSQENSAYVLQWTCHNLEWSDQEMEVYPVDGIWHMINPRHSAGKCLAVSAARTAPGTSLIQWTCNLQAREQHFAFLQAPGGQHQIIARHSNQCVGVSNSSRDNGGRVIQWPCTDVDDQFWWVNDGVPFVASARS